MAHHSLPRLSSLSSPLVSLLLFWFSCLLLHLLPASCHLGWFLVWFRVSLGQGRSEKRRTSSNSTHSMVWMGKRAALTSLLLKVTVSERGSNRFKTSSNRLKPGLSLVLEKIYKDLNFERCGSFIFGYMGFNRLHLV